MGRAFACLVTCFCKQNEPWMKKCSRNKVYNLLTSPDAGFTRADFRSTCSGKSRRRRCFSQTLQRLFEVLAEDAPPKDTYQRGEHASFQVLSHAVQGEVNLTASVLASRNVIVPKAASGKGIGCLHRDGDVARLRPVVMSALPHTPKEGRALGHLSRGGLHRVHLIVAWINVGPQL